MSQFKIKNSIPCVLLNGIKVKAEATSLSMIETHDTHHTPAGDVVDLINSFAKLTDLKLCGLDLFTDELFQRIDNSVFGRLKRIAFRNNSLQITDASVLHMSVTCKQLVDIRLDFRGSSEMKESQIIPLLIANPHLTGVYLVGFPLTNLFFDTG